MKTAKATRPSQATATARRAQAVPAPTKIKKSKAPRHPRTTCAPDEDALLRAQYKDILSRLGSGQPISIVEQEQQVRTLLRLVVTPEEAERWLHAPRRKHGKRTPLSMIQQGDGEILVLELVRLVEGIPT